MTDQSSVEIILKAAVIPPTYETNYVGGGTGVAKQERSRELHRCGEKLLDEMLAVVGVTAPIIEHGKRGKPYLKSFPHITFNLSHSGRAALCAVGINAGEIGVDLEYIDRGEDKELHLYSREAAYERIAKELFSAREIEQIGSSPDSAAEFFKIWTAHEAYSKFTGDGISQLFRDKGCDEYRGARVFTCTTVISGLEYAVSLAVGRGLTDRMPNIEIINL